MRGGETEEDHPQPSTKTRRCHGARVKQAKYRCKTSSVDTQKPMIVLLFGHLPTASMLELFSYIKTYLKTLRQKAHPLDSPCIISW